MKKKFIQILMLLIATVSVGSFVSCKDTSEDLYNELRTQAFSENASLKEALDAYGKKLNDQIALYEQLERELKAIKEGDIPNLTARLDEQFNLITDLKTQLEGKADQSEVDELRHLIEMLSDQINGNEGILINLQNLLENDAAQDALIAALQKEIADLKAWKQKLDEWWNHDNYTEILDWIKTLQQEMTEAKDKINAAIAKADAAQATADEALALANTAFDNAQKAIDLANKAQGKADDAWDLAKNALEIANAAKDVATRALALAETNKDAIARLQTITDELSKLANENKTNIAVNKANIEKNAENIQKAMADIKDLSDQIASMNATLALMSQDIKDAFNKASEALGTANANSLEIAALKELIKNLQNSLDNLDSNKLDLADLQDLIDKVNCHSTELATLEVEVGLVLAESIAHFEAAKCYANQQIELAKTQIMSEVMKLLSDYLKKGDVDLSKYVTKDELANYLTKAEAANYATKAELANYVPKDVLDALLQGLEAKMNAADAALELALQKLIAEEIGKLGLADILSRITATETEIGNLKDQYNNLNTLYNSLNSQMGNFVTKEDILTLIDKLIDKLGDEYSHNGNTHDNTYNITDLLDIIVDLTKTDVSAEVNLKIASIEAELLDCIKKSELDAILAGYVKKEDIPDGLAEAIATLAEIKTKVDKIDGLEEKIKDLEKIAGDLGELAALSAKVKVLEATSVKYDDIKDFIKEEDLEKFLTKYVTKAEYDKFVTETYVTDKTELLNKINANTTQIGEIKGDITKINNEITGIKDDISKLQKDVKANTDKLNELETKYDKAIADLKTDVATIQNNLSKLVTGIIIQGTSNPMFGSFSLPVNIQSNILVAYWGKPSSAVEFPTTDDANYVRKDEVLTAADWAMINDVDQFTMMANKTLLNDDGDGNANAGKIYMTINPNTADLTGLKLSIVNTQDEESPIKLSPIRPSKKILQFGYNQPDITRADNGFYEADAYVSLADIKSGKNGLALSPDDVTALYQEAKEQIGKIAENFGKPDKQTNLGDLAVKVYSVLSDLNVDQNGLKCTYTDAESKEHSVYSQYNLAATFMNPLNLAWGKDFNYVTMPGYEVVDKLLDDMAATLKDHVNVLFSDAIDIDHIKDIINGLKIDEVKLVGMADNYVAKFEARVSHITLDGVDYELKIPAAGSFDVMFDKNLKASGSAVTVPDAVKYDADNINLKRPAVVIGGDINTGMEVMIVVPATGATGVVSAYATLKLFDETAKATYDSGSIKLTITEGTYTIANYAGSAISTSGCTDKLVLRDVVGNDGALYLPIITEITGDIRDLIDKQITTLDALVVELNNILDKINSYNGTINGWIDDYVDEYLRKYLDQINDDVTFFFNSINRRFGPFMVASNKNKGFKRLSESKSYPTELVKGDLAFHPTTKTMELIVPLARKHVAVTNVFKGSASAQGGDASCKAALKKANTGNLNKVLDGVVRKIEVTGMESGYVYEVAYSVLDFEGNISTQRYYVTIK